MILAGNVSTVMLSDMASLMKAYEAISDAVVLEGVCYLVGRRETLRVRLAVSRVPDAARIFHISGPTP